MGNPVMCSIDLEPPKKYKSVTKLPYNVSRWYVKNERASWMDSVGIKPTPIEWDF